MRTQFLNCYYFLPRIICQLPIFFGREKYLLVQQFLYEAEIWLFSPTILKDTVFYLMKVHSFRLYYCSKWWQSDIVKCMSLNLKDFWTQKISHLGLGYRFISNLNESKEEIFKQNISNAFPFKPTKTTFIQALHGNKTFHSFWLRIAWKHFKQISTFLLMSIKWLSQSDYIQLDAFILLIRHFKA